MVSFINYYEYTLSCSLFSNVLVIGLGLIGGSFAKALRLHKVCTSLTAYDLDSHSIELALLDKTIDASELDLSKLSRHYDLIILATPLSAYESILSLLDENDLRCTTIIDLGSLKNFIYDILPAKMQGRFIGCHPIAGSEKVGYANSTAELFKGKKFIVCSKYEGMEELNKIMLMSEQLGCTTLMEDSEEHDSIYSLVSHLPHLISFASKSFSPKTYETQLIKNAYRLDHADSTMWLAIFKQGRDNLRLLVEKLLNNVQRNYDETLLFRSDVSAEVAARILIVRSYLQLVNETPEVLAYAGTGFRDFTSILELVEDDSRCEEISIEKRKQVLDYLEAFSKSLLLENFTAVQEAF